MEGKRVLMMDIDPQGDLTAVETGLVNIMSRETVLRQYVDSVKHNYDYVLLDCLPSNNARPYDHEYSDLAVEVASLIQEQYPLVDFSILELIQLNDFVNHQLAHNVLFLSVESDVIEFVFDMLKDQYFGKVFINPTLEMYHQYWSDNMIVINKLTTEAPKSAGIPWYTRLEKLLVDIVADPLLLDSVSESEYPTIYEDAFSMYVVDESCLFRYAARRAVDKKIKKLIREKTNITLRTKR